MLSLLRWTGAKPADLLLSKGLLLLLREEIRLYTAREKGPGAGVMLGRGGGDPADLLVRGAAVVLLLPCCCCGGSTAGVAVVGGHQFCWELAGRGDPGAVRPGCAHNEGALDMQGGRSACCCGSAARGLVGEIWLPMAACCAAVAAGECCQGGRRPGCAQGRKRQGSWVLLQQEVGMEG